MLSVRENYCPDQVTFRERAISPHHNRRLVESLEGGHGGVAGCRGLGGELGEGLEEGGEGREVVLCP
jgi:hypothetical protein